MFDTHPPSPVSFVFHPGKQLITQVHMKSARLGGRQSPLNHFVPDSTSKAGLKFIDRDTVVLSGSAARRRTLCW
jgi:hypothetical protein